jgi:hypothetical protein
MRVQTGREHGQKAKRDPFLFGPAKYGTTHLGTWGRDRFPVYVLLERF